MSEMTFTSLKNSHDMREYEEKKIKEKKRYLVYLIAQYLRDEGYFDTIRTFQQEAQLSNLYQICDNIDLPMILQDFESYYYVRFQKYPKIWKKTNPEEGVINFSKKVSKILNKRAGAVQIFLPCSR